jgi:hypothetical protein
MSEDKEKKDLILLPIIFKPLHYSMTIGNLPTSINIINYVSHIDPNIVFRMLMLGYPCIRFPKSVDKDVTIKESEWVIVDEYNTCFKRTGQEDKCQ